MIPKGNQRGGGQQLATHLMNSFDNDRVAIAEVRGAIAQDLHGAFAEWYAESKATKCIKYLYSLSINPDHTQGPFTREHYDDFVRRVEDRLGLANQPRAVVVHVKHGREHWHVVWSRIDTDKMKAVQLSYDHEDLRTVAQEYARDHKIILPEGMRKNRERNAMPTATSRKISATSSARSAPASASRNASVRFPKPGTRVTAARPSSRRSKNAATTSRGAIGAPMP